MNNIPKILIVDDQPENIGLIEAFLEAAGYTNTVSAGSAVEAYKELGLGKKCVATDVDLILMDVMMPNIDGIRACHHIISEETLKEIPIIMVTADMDKNTLKKSFKAGAMDYITKPVSDVELLARVESALALKRERDLIKARERDLVEANVKLEDISNMDDLTGIANRRYLNIHLDNEWRRSIRSGLPISLIMIDIDFFKQFNDIYGHQEGDDCLKRVARTFSLNLKRPADLVARYGGEEFTIVLPETTIKGGSELAEIMRKKILELDIAHKGSEVSCGKVTISAGISSTFAHMKSSPEELIEEADRALYKAKEEGRNRVKVGKIGDLAD